MLFEETSKKHTGEKSNKCNECDLANMLSLRQAFEETFENAEWRKVKQMSRDQVYYNHLRPAKLEDI